MQGTIWKEFVGEGGGFWAGLKTRLGLSRGDGAILVYGVEQCVGGMWKTEEELFRSRVYGVGSGVHAEFLWKCHALYVCMVWHVGEGEMMCMVVGEKMKVWRSGQLSRVNAELNEGLLSSKVDGNIWLGLPLVSGPRHSFGECPCAI